MLSIAPAQLIYNLGNGQGFTVRQVIEGVRRVTGRAIPVVESPRREGDPGSVDRQLRENSKRTELEAKISRIWSRFWKAHGSGTRIIPTVIARARLQSCRNRSGPDPMGQFELGVAPTPAVQSAKARVGVGLAASHATAVARPS